MSISHLWFQNEKNIERLRNFSDAVIAIALTLLVLNIELPHTNHLDWQIIWCLHPKFLSYLISFFAIARFWFAHLRLWDKITQLDGFLILLNFIFLFFIAFLPFPSLVYGTHGDSFLALSLYVCWLTLTSLSLSSIWLYLRKHPQLVHKDASLFFSLSALIKNFGIILGFLFPLVIVLLYPYLFDWYWLLFGIVMIIIQQSHKLLSR